MITDPKTAKVFFSTSDQLRAEGKVELVLRCLEARFGPLSEKDVARVRATDPAELDELAVRIFGATSVDAVFARE